MTHSNNGIKRVIFISRIVGALGGVTQAVDTLAEEFERRGMSIEHLSRGVPNPYHRFAHHSITHIDEGIKKTLHNPLAREHKGPLGLKYLAKAIYTPVWDYQYRQKLRSLFASYDSSCLVIITDSMTAHAVLPAISHRKKQPNPPHFAFAFHNAFVSDAHDMVKEIIPEILTEVDDFIALSDEDARLFSQEYSYPVRAISNGIAPSGEDLDHKNPHSLVAITRFSYEKNVDVIIRAFHAVSPDFPEWTLDIYGEGDTKESMVELVESLGVQNCRIHDSISREEVQKVLANSSLGIMASSFEGLPMFILESMVAAVPIISSPSSPAVIDLIGRYGYLAKSASVEDITEQLRIALANNQEREAKARASLQGSQEFSPEAIAQKWLDLKR